MEEMSSGDGGRRGVVAAVLAAAAVALASACGGDRDAPATVVMADESEVVSLNSLVPGGAVGEQIQKYVLFTTLVRLDSALEPRPYLARSWELNEEGTELTVRLREDVRWSDGEPTTAEDVAFTFRRAKDPDVPFPNRSYFDRWESVEVVDEYTLRFRLRPHYGYMLGWAETAIMPAHVLGDVDPSELRSHPFGAGEAVTNGPFRLAEHRPQERWTFTANPEFPEALGGPPEIERLVYRIVPEPSARLAELRAGRVHMVPTLSAEAASGLEGEPEVVVETHPRPAYTFIVWNTRRELFASPRVRRALTMALDREGILRSVRGGHGSVAGGPVGPWHWAHDTAWRPLPHDPDSARSLLAAEGWRDRDGDGVRERDGRDFSFELLTNPGSERRDIAVMVQSDLGEVGVEVSPRSRESTAMASSLTRPEREFDAAVLSWVRDILVDDEDLWACDRRDAPYQFTGYCNPTVDAVLDTAARARDREERRRLLRRYHELVGADQPYTFLYHETGLSARRRSLEGVRMGPRGQLVTVARWRLEGTP